MVHMELDLGPAGGWDGEGRMAVDNGRGRRHVRPRGGRWLLQERIRSRAWDRGRATTAGCGQTLT